MSPSSTARSSAASPLSVRYSLGAGSTGADGAGRSATWPRTASTSATLSGTASVSGQPRYRSMNPNCRDGRTVSDVWIVVFGIVVILLFLHCRRARPRSTAAIRACRCCCSTDGRASQRAATRRASVPRRRAVYVVRFSVTHWLRSFHCRSCRRSSVATASRVRVVRPHERLIALQVPARSAHRVRIVRLDEREEHGRPRLHHVHAIPMPRQPLRVRVRRITHEPLRLPHRLPHDIRNGEVTLVVVGIVQACHRQVRPVVLYPSRATK